MLRKSSFAPLHTPASSRKLVLRAFTLIEVLVSFAILSTLLIALTQAQTEQASLVNFSGNYIKVQKFVHKELLDAYRNSKTIVPGINEGEFGEESPLAGYTWKREVSEEELLTATVKKVVYSISWQEGFRERNYRGWVYVP